MPSLRVLLIGLALASAATLLFTGCHKTNEVTVREIKFDLGKNIVETAKASGVPSFESDDVNGSISYSVKAIRPDIPAFNPRNGNGLDRAKPFCRGGDA